MVVFNLSSQPAQAVFFLALVRRFWLKPTLEVFVFGTKAVFPIQF